MDYKVDGFGEERSQLNYAGVRYIHDIQVDEYLYTFCTQILFVVCGLARRISKSI